MLHTFDHRKVSVLIPVFNAEPYLTKTLKNVFQQTYNNIEIIIVDDGSTDNSLEIARGFEGENCKVITQKNNGGGAARNRAFQESSGYYIQYLDADDLISPDKIQRQVKLLKETGSSDVIASCSWQRFTDDGVLPEKFFPREIDKDYDHPVEWLLDSWTGKGMAANSCWLTPRDIVIKAGPWDERLRINQDGEFFCRVLLQAKGIKYTPSVNVFYRAGNEQSVTAKMNIKKCASQLLSYRLYESHILPIEDSMRVREALMHNYLGFMYHNYNCCRSLMLEAKASIQKLGFNTLKAHGGSRFKILANIIGFENALYLRSKLNIN